jgi:hypothetical protein
VGLAYVNQFAEGLCRADLCFDDADEFIGVSGGRVVDLFSESLEVFDDGLGRVASHELCPGVVEIVEDGFVGAVEADVVAFDVFGQGERYGQGRDAALAVLIELRE